MDYAIPKSHLELLQRIWEELVLVRDPDAIFTGTLGHSEPVKKEDES